MVTDKGGVARCLDAKTGDEVWKKRLGGDHWASPIYADGKLYFTSKQGDITVLTASRDKPEELASNELNAEFIASPAVAGDSLLLRSTTHLYCIANGHQRTVEQVAADVYPERRPVKRGAKAVAKNGAKKGNADERLAALGKQLKAMVKGGKLTAKDAIEIYQAAAEK